MKSILEKWMVHTMYLEYHLRLQKVCLALFLIAIVISLPACGYPPSWGTPDPEYLKLLDQGPCWNRICPDQTSLQDALDIASTLDIIDPTQVTHIRERNEVAVGFVEQRFGASDLLLKYVDRTVHQISLEIYGDKATLSELGRKLTLSQVIDYFGQPTLIMATGFCPGDLAKPVYSFELWYREKGITVSTGAYRVGNPSEGLIPEPRLRIPRIIYHATNMDTEQWFEVAQGPWLNSSASEVAENLHPWPGWEESLPSYVDACK